MQGLREIGESWKDFQRARALRLETKITKTYARAGAPEYETPREIQEVFNEVEVSLNHYREHIRRSVEEDGEEVLILKEKFRKAEGNDAAPKNDAPSAPLKFPEGTHWEQVNITFKDGHDVVITLGDKRYNKNYKEMGFQDGRKRQPNKQWERLQVLAVQGGSIAWGDATANEKISKQKQLLSGKLKDFFGIQEDPFYDYRKEKAYRIRLNLSPEPSMKKAGRSGIKESKDDLGREEHLREVAPSVFTRSDSSSGFFSDEK